MNHFGNQYELPAMKTPLAKDYSQGLSDSALGQVAEWADRAADACQGLASAADAARFAVLAGACRSILKTNQLAAIERLAAAQ